MNVTAGRRVGWSVINLLVILYALIPVLWIVSLSFKPQAKVTDGNFIPTSFSFENYKNIFKTNEFTSALINSIVVTKSLTADHDANAIGGEVDIMEWYGNGSWAPGTTVHVNLNGGEHVSHTITPDSACARTSCPPLWA